MPDPDTLTVKDRRLALRRPPRGKVRAVCRRGALELGPDLALAVVDLSETGVRLAVREALQPGGEVTVALEGPLQSRPVKRVGRVVWSLSAADGSCQAGVVLQGRLPYSDFLALT